MVYLTDLEGKDDLHFTYAVFGVQHSPGTLNPRKKELISTLHTLLTTGPSHAGHINIFKDENHGREQGETQATIFIAYWLPSNTYHLWKEDAAVKSFWEKLEEDAGVWREVMQVPKARFMGAATHDKYWGFTELIKSLRTSKDEGYWGVYRHRLGGDDPYTSQYITATSAAKGKSEEEVKVMTIPERQVGGSSAIRKGRVLISHPPEHLLFVREGQRAPTAKAPAELAVWMERIAPHARSWMDHLDDNRDKVGVLVYSSHLTQKNFIDGDEPSEDVIPETNQLIWYLDLAHFERSGRQHKGHVQLRKATMEVYGYGGVMNEDAKAELFVELCVLKDGDLEAEYIGCTEGTGLMFLEGL